jgi:hypothetical protein
MNLIEEAINSIVCDKEKEANLLNTLKEILQYKEGYNKEGYEKYYKKYYEKNKERLNKDKVERARNKREKDKLINNENIIYT